MSSISTSTSHSAATVAKLRFQNCLWKHQNISDFRTYKHRFNSGRGWSCLSHTLSGFHFVRFPKTSESVFDFRKECRNQLCWSSKSQTGSKTCFSKFLTHVIHKLGHILDITGLIQKRRNGLLTVEFFLWGTCLYGALLRTLLLSFHL